MWLIFNFNAWKLIKKKNLIKIDIFITREIIYAINEHGNDEKIE